MASRLRTAALTGVFVVLVSLWGGFEPAQGGARDPAAFVQGLGDQVVAILRSGDGTRAARKERFRALFAANFDVPAIGRFVLGRQWRSITDEQRSRYLKLFREYVADIYAGQFSTYSGETFAVLRQRPLDDADTLVNSEIRRPGKAALRVDFRVRDGAEGLRIIDVVVEGVSLIVTKRSEFQSILEREGMDGLMARLETYLSG